MADQEAAARDDLARTRETERQKKKAAEDQQTAAAETRAQRGLVQQLMAAYPNSRSHRPGEERPAANADAPEPSRVEPTAAVSRASTTT